MERLAHRDLRNRSSEVLRTVAQGASYEITNHGDVVALLLPVTKLDAGLGVRTASAHRGFSALRRVRRTESVAAALDALRGER